MGFFLTSIILGVFLFSQNTVCSQTGSQNDKAENLLFQGLGNDSILSAFAQRFHVLDSLLDHSANMTGRQLPVHYLSTKPIDSIYNVKREYEHKAFRRKNGLELTGQVYQRLDNKFGFDEDDNLYSAYSSKLQGEIGWNFFNSSFLQRKSELRLIDLDNQLECLQQKKQNAETGWEDLVIGIEKKYDLLTASVLYEQLKNMEVLNMAYLFTLKKERTGSEKLLEVMNEKMRIEHALAQAGASGCATGGLQTGRIEISTPVMVEIDSIGLFENIRNNNTEIQSLLIREDILGVKRRLTNYAHEMRLTPFVRVSHYLRDALPSSTNVEVGARFTFPFYDVTSAKRKALQTEKNITALKRENVSADLLGECRRFLYRLDKLNKSIAAEYRYSDKLVGFIGIRKEAYLKSLNGYNHIARLEEYNEYLKSIERMYNLLRIRELCLIDILKTSGCTDLNAVVKTKNIPE